MNKEEYRIEYFRDIQMTDLLEALGEKVYKGRFRCPDAAQHKHGDKNPSASINKKSGGTRWGCFACGAGFDHERRGDAIGYVRLKYGYSHIQALDFLYNLGLVPPEAKVSVVTSFTIPRPPKEVTDEVKIPYTDLFACNDITIKRNCRAIIDRLKNCIGSMNIFCEKVIRDYPEIAPSRIRQGVAKREYPLYLYMEDIIECHNAAVDRIAFSMGYSGNDMDFMYADDEVGEYKTIIPRERGQRVRDDSWVLLPYVPAVLAAEADIDQKYLYVKKSEDREETKERIQENVDIIYTKLHDYEHRLQDRASLLKEMIPDITKIELAYIDGKTRSLLDPVERLSHLYSVLWNHPDKIPEDDLFKENPPEDMEL